MTFAAFSSWIVTLIAAILVSFLRAFVIVDLIDLFNVPYFYELWFKMFEKIFFVLASWGLAYLVSYFVL